MTRAAEIKAMITNVMHHNVHRLRGRQVILFGSRAAGRARANSDFDIGVIGDTPRPLQDFYAIEDQLEDLPAYPTHHGVKCSPCA
ncbi:MAG TPA: nucleotidyltransferase domain-containing protein [Thiobacillaceae bacterium]|nr:nucleotidyltransferase domain-containing protein [Thiobacillaceae bacterium]